MPEKFEINKECVINELKNRAVIFEPSGREIYILEDEEYHILKMFKSACSFEAVIKQLEIDYNVTGIEQDVVSFVMQLVEKEILRGAR